MGSHQATRKLSTFILQRRSFSPVLFYRVSLINLSFPTLSQLSFNLFGKGPIFTQHNKNHESALLLMKPAWSLEGYGNYTNEMIEYSIVYELCLEI